MMSPTEAAHAADRRSITLTDSGEPVKNPRHADYDYGAIDGLIGTHRR